MNALSADVLAKAFCNSVCSVIGKNGETIKALQQFTGAQIQIDQRCDPTRVSIAGPPKSLQIATSMVQVKSILVRQALLCTRASLLLLAACLGPFVCGCGRSRRLD